MTNSTELTVAEDAELFFLWEHLYASLGRFVPEPVVPTEVNSALIELINALPASDRGKLIRFHGLDGQEEPTPQELIPGSPEALASAELKLVYGELRKGLHSKGLFYYSRGP